MSDKDRLELEKLTARLLRELMGALKDALPPGVGAALFLLDFGAKGNIAYASTARRQDMIKAIREWLGHVED